MAWPPGHQPGIHVPGTTVPIAYVVAQAQAQQGSVVTGTTVVSDMDRRRRVRLLLLHPET